MDNVFVLIWVMAAVVLIGVPIATLIYTNMFYSGPIDLPLTFFGIISFLAGIYVFVVKIYPIYKGVEGVRKGE